MRVSWGYPMGRQLPDLIQVDLHEALARKRLS
jgi:hypothetical protein